MDEQTKMLKLLAPGDEVIIQLFQKLNEAWAFNRDRGSIIDGMTAIKISDEGDKMLLQLGLNEIRVPYSRLTCKALQSLNKISPDDLTRFTAELDEQLGIIKKGGARVSLINK